MTIALAPFFANTPSVSLLVRLRQLLTFAPLVLPNVIPERWGVQHTHPHEAYASYMKLFKFISVIGFLLHLKATAVGLAYNAPAAFEHRHSIHLPFDVESRSAWERTTSSFGRLLSATSDHPVVSGIGWDVLLSTVSIGLWAAIRAIDISGILASTVPLYALHRDDVDELTALPAASAARKRGSGKIKAITTGTEGDAQEENGTGSIRKRGRPRKNRDAPVDDSYEPTAAETASAVEGDAIPGGDKDLDWEAAALAWGFTVLGGLGVGSAGVLGGECIAR